MKSWCKGIKSYGLCWLLILVSCTASHYRVLKESDFHKTVVLSPKLTFETTNITDFAIKGDRVIIRNSLRDDSIFMLYSVPDCRLLSAFGNKGRGEGEWLILSDSCLILNIINRSENLIVKHKKSSEVVLYDFPDLSVSLKDPQAYYVEEYDWDGNPVKKYKLDHFVKYLGYAKDCFIGVAPDGEAPFVAYKLWDE